KLEADAFVDRDIDFYIRYLYSIFRAEKFTDGAIGGAENKGIFEVIFLSIIKQSEEKKHYWENLSPLELGKFSEYYAKMEFLKNGFQVFQTEVDDRGIDFVTKIQNNFFEIQVKSVRLKKTSYVFFTKTEKFYLRDNLHICLAIFSEDLNPQVYLIPTIDLDSDNGLFIYREYREDQKSKPEWGINLSKKHIEKLKKYAIDLAVIKLKI